jgi:nitroreductase
MDDLIAALKFRFGAAPDTPPETLGDISFLESLASRRSHRRFKPEGPSLDLLRFISAVALSAPSKSDLQARDIVIVTDAEKRQRIAKDVVGQAWLESAPVILVFLGNNKRQRQIHQWREKPFENDHLDALFNPAVDAGIAMQAFMDAAESVGLGCCPVSGIRNNCPLVNDLLELPDHVFPVVGLGVGWPSQEGHISARLPLEATVHVDTFSDDDIKSLVTQYDNRRYAIHHPDTQRQEDRFGRAEKYTWSEDKARQYASPERADFGAYIRSKGFKLD